MLRCWLRVLVEEDPTGNVDDTEEEIVREEEAGFNEGAEDDQETGFKEGAEMMKKKLHLMKALKMMQQYDLELEFQLD